MKCPELLRTQSWLDGEFGERESEKAKAHVQNCAECGAFVIDATTLGDRVRREANRHRAPERLVSRVTRALDAESVRLSRNGAGRRGFWVGAAGGVSASALAAAIVLLGLHPPSSDSLVDSIGQAHVRALMTHRTISVASSNHHRVKPWFAGRVPLSPPVADFAAQGFTLAGGRTDTISGAPAAVLAYRHGRHEVDLYVWADHGWKLPPGGTMHGYRMQFWKSGDLDFAAVSDTETAELAKFARLVKSERE